MQWHDVFATSSALSFFLVAWWILDGKLPPLSSVPGKLVFGLFLGATCVLGMSMAHEIQDGYWFDLRHAFISGAGLFGGPLAGFVTGSLAALYRLYMGGAGTLPGIISILVSAVIGGIGFFMIPVGSRNLVRLLAFATCVTSGALVSFYSIQIDVRHVLLDSAGLPLLVLTFLTTFCTTLLLEQDARRKKAIRQNETYAAMVRAFPDCLNVKDLDGQFVVANEATAYLMRAESAEELIGKTDFDFYPRDIAQRFREDELDVLSSGKPQRIQQRVILQSGEKGLLSTTKIPMKDSSGRFVGLITHNQEIPQSSSSLRSMF